MSDFVFYVWNKQYTFYYSNRTDFTDENGDTPKSEEYKHTSKVEIRGYKGRHIET